MPSIARLALAVATFAAAIHASPPAAQQPLNKDHARPLVDSETLQGLVDPDTLYKRAEKLYDIAKLSEDVWNRPNRVIGSEGHKGTIRYIVDTLKSLGGYYDVSLQPFDVVMGIVYESHLVLGDKVIGDALPLKNTPATASKEPVHSRLVLAAKSGCNASDYDAAKNKIVLVKRGDCALGDKSELAGRAGAKALVIYNTKDEDFYGTVGEPKPDHVATFSIRSSYGEPLAKKLLNGEAVDAIAYIDGSVETIHTQNVLAQTTSGDPNHCIMLGGHSDGVDAGPGINDDGSGSISVLEIAVQLAKFRVNNCVRFAWWSAEEEGLLGSNYYAYHLSPAENQKIRLFVDLDMLASPNYAYQIYNATNDENPAGSEEYRDLLAEWYKAQGLNSMYTEFDGRSDYVGFIQNGIPAGGFSTGAEGVKTEEEVELFGGVAGEWYDKNYHQIGDDLANLNMTAWEMNTKLIAHTVATYARSFKGFPERHALATATTSQSFDTRFKYRGSYLII